MRTYFFNKLQNIESLCKRSKIDFSGVEKVVKEVLQAVKQDGDKAIKFYTEKFDGQSPRDLIVSQKEIEEACKKIPKNIKNAFQTAAKNIEKFHKSQIEKEKIIKTTDGVICWRSIRPIEKIGLYIPGGTAPLPSTVLMLGIPAKIAGCKEIIMCTPPKKDGKIPDIILYTAKLAEITKIFKVGGAQAIAGMGYGTKTISRVYKIFGPGNQYVTLAKMLISIEANGPAMDMPAGPSEVLIIADESARADFIAADLLSQAEHGPDSQVVLVTTSQNKAQEVSKEISKQLSELPRESIAKEALDGSFSIITSDIEQAFEFSNKYAPEHLILNIKNPKKYLKNIQNAGSVFVGEYSCESAGDYASGTNHTLPTYGYAKAYSGVSTDSFIKKITFQKLTLQGAKNLSKTVANMAETEGLGAHKEAILIRTR